MSLNSPARLLMKALRPLDDAVLRIDTGAGDSGGFECPRDQRVTDVPRLEASTERLRVRLLLLDARLCVSICSIEADCCLLGLLLSR